MDGYALADLNEFDALSIPAATYNENMQDLGQVTYKVYQGKDAYGLLFNDEVLWIGTNNKNPIAGKKTWAYIDENRVLYGGIFEN